MKSKLSEQGRKILAVIEANPTLTSSEVAAKLGGVSAYQVYQIAYKHAIKMPRDRQTSETVAKRAGIIREKLTAGNTLREIVKELNISIENAFYIIKKYGIPYMHKRRMVKHLQVEEREAATFEQSSTVVESRVCGVVNNIFI